MKRSFLFLFVLVSLFVTASTASALDRYQSREGFYLHLGGMFGGGQSYKSDKNQNRHVIFDRKIDYGANVGAGFGFNEMFIFGGEVSWIGQNREIFLLHSTGKIGSSFTHNIDVLAHLDVFLFKGFVLGVGAGFAYQIYDVTLLSNHTLKDDSFFGFGLKGSIGYEGFVTGDLAIGGRFYYLRNFYGQQDYDSLGAAVSLRWY